MPWSMPEIVRVRDIFSVQRSVVLEQFTVRTTNFLVSSIIQHLIHGRLLSERAEDYD